MSSQSQNQASTSKSEPLNIPVWAMNFISKQEILSVEDAVKVAESETSGEIVPMIVKSSVQSKMPQRILFLSLSILILIIQYLLNYNGSFDFFEYLYLLDLILVLLAFYLSFYRPLPNILMRLLTPEDDQIDFVDIRAELEFNRCRLRNTSAKTGILLFVSHAEQRAVVLADESIAAKLPPETWKEVLDLMIKGFKNKNVGQGMVHAITRCGEILKVHFPIEATDQNELTNHLILKE